jgi:hypothetical protein
LRITAYVGGVLGLALLITLLVRADLGAMLHTLQATGASLLWLIPVRALYYLLYALGWLNLLRSVDPERRAGIGYLFWVTSVRDAIDRLLPVASVGGSVVGIRLMRWRGLGVAPVSATISAMQCAHADHGRGGARSSQEPHRATRGPASTRSTPLIGWALRPRSISGRQHMRR